MPTRIVALARSLPSSLWKPIYRPAFPFRSSVLVPMKKLCVHRLSMDGCGNGVAIFTRDSDAARDFAAKVQIATVTVNVPIPVPIVYPFAGFGEVNQHSPDSFLNETKTVTSRGPSGVKEGAEFVIPVIN